MNWLRWLGRGRREGAEEALREIQHRFATFLALLDANNRVLKTIGDLEEKNQGKQLFGADFVRDALDEIVAGVHEIVESMIDLGGESYEPLRERLGEIEGEIESIFSGHRSVRPDRFVIPFGEIDGSRVASVGGKNAQLGELRHKLGLRVPDGFAITAWAYRYFVDSNDLQRRISEKLETVDIGRYGDLVRVSEEIQAMVRAGSIPDDLRDAIRTAFEGLAGPSSIGGYALRSSAIGEDGHFSFAGQYATFLNVTAPEIVERYREVLAQKFTPKAIYYLISHGFEETEMAMAVGCVSMVDAAVSGVIYTQDPVHPEEGCMLVNAVYGLGRLLVDGSVTPDGFKIARDNGELIDSRVAHKSIRLVMRQGSGTVSEKVPKELRDLSSLNDDQLRELAEIALKVEAHYGAPQDIEWALDQDGRIYLLQSRPLGMVRAVPGHAPVPIPHDAEIVLTGGTAVCPGAGSGGVYHAVSSADLPDVPEGCVLIAPHPFPGLIAAMEKISALVTEVGGVASHAATLAREYRIPTVMGMEDATLIPVGKVVTVDATGATIYGGEHDALVKARAPRTELFEEAGALGLLHRVLTWVAPLNLLHPADPGFTLENCRTIHDLTRYCHQMSMQVMFEQACDISYRERLGTRLRTGLPMQVNIFYLDEVPRSDRVRWIEEDEIRSEPMRAFWAGVKEQPWPMAHRATGEKSHSAMQVTGGFRTTYSENSCAILSREYMIVSLRMGYHFTTVEAMCTQEPSKNFIRMQYKHGGPSLDRRIRRLKLITDILSSLGFENASKGDFLDSGMTYVGDRVLMRRLRLLGRLIVMTKQLDMALATDEVAEWYTIDFMKKLGLVKGQED
jgi:pyruvate,water dikinase